MNRLRKRIYGLLNPDERRDREQLEEYREKRCLSADDMHNLIKERGKSEGVCPVCGKVRSHGE